MNSLRSLLVGMLFFLPTIAAAEAPPDLVFDRLLVLQPVDNAGLPAQSESMRLILWSEWTGLLQFEIVSIPEPTRSGPFTSDEIRRRAIMMGADGAITSRLGRTDGSIVVTVELISAHSGDLVVQERRLIQNWKDPQIFRDQVAAAVQRIAGRLPYRAVVRSADPDLIRITAGRIHGLDPKSPIKVERVTAVRKNPLTGEVVEVTKRPVAELRAFRIGETSSLANVSRFERGMSIRVGDVVTFEPNAALMAESAPRRQALLAQKEKDQADYEKKLRAEPVRPSPTPPVATPREPAPPLLAKTEPEGTRRIRVGLGFGVGWNRFRLNSAEADIKRSASVYPVAMVSGGITPKDYLDIDLAAQTGWISFSDQDSVSIDRKAVTTALSGQVALKRRDRLGEVTVASFLGTGFDWRRFSPDKTDDAALLNVTYSGPFLGVGWEITPSPSFGLLVGARYFPWISVGEDPVDSGSDPKAMGLAGEIGVFYHLWKGVRLDLLASRTEFRSDFQDTGDRFGGISEAETREVLTTVAAILQYSF